MLMGAVPRVSAAGTGIAPVAQAALAGGAEPDGAVTAAAQALG